MTFDWDSSKYATISDLQAKVGYMLIDALQPKPHERVLDIGCGIGNLTIELASRCHNGFVLGIDASPSMISQAQMQSRRLTNLEFCVQDAEHLPFHQEFDAVFSNSALHWLPESNQVLATIRTALKPGGRIGIQFPLLNEHHPLISFTRQAIKSLELERYYQKWRFPWFVTTEEAYTSLLCDAGYQNVTVTMLQTTHRFGSPFQAYDFFDAVGLELYLVPLGAEQKQHFQQTLRQELDHANTAQGILFHFERLFAFGSVPH